MPISKDREYRAIDMVETRDSEDGAMYVEGYASTFKPYVLYSYDGVDYSERIEPTAFDGADMSDVIFQKDHTGTVMARTSNGTIELSVDSHGLHQRTDLSKTAKARETYEEIKAGMYPKMSFAFTVAEDHFEAATNTRVIDKIKKVYDVSAVSFPANPDTEINVSARDYFNGVIEAMETERMRAEEERAKELEILRLKMKL